MNGGYKIKRLLLSITFLFVLTVCLPVYGEILVYKYSHRFTEFELADADDSQWNVQSSTNRGYFIVDVNFVNGTVQNGRVEASALILYGRDGRDKWLEIRDFRSMQIVRFIYGQRDTVKWLFIDDDSDVDDLDADGILMAEGTARYTDIGLGRDDQREVAMSLRGYTMANETKSQGGITALREGDIENGKVSIRLDSRWTKKANAADGFNQDFETVLFDAQDGIIAYLEGRDHIARLSTD